jgi:uncharacterized protein YihD (DUF1040 family)
MRDPNRIDPILEAIRAIWKQYPDFRLTQLLSNAAISSKLWSDNDLYHLEDEKLLQALKKFAEKFPTESHFKCNLPMGDRGGVW